MSSGLNRRGFLASTAALAGACTLGGTPRSAVAKAKSPVKPLYKISLAEWSMHRALRAGKLDHLDFSRFAKEECGISGVEYVNQFFKDKAKDKKYLAELNKRAHDLGVTQVLIMIDGEGHLGDPDAAKRTKAIENHYQWVTAAKTLGCHSIRVNAHSSNDFLESMPLAADGLHRLCEFADQHDINVIVENHGGLSSNGAWLSGVMELADHRRVGTLPDFGNFSLGGGKSYDRYKGVMQLMPYAKAVSAKTYGFNKAGEETTINYHRMMDIVTTWGYDGFVGIEWEGGKMPEKDGILASKKLLEVVREKLSPGV